MVLAKGLDILGQLAFLHNEAKFKGYWKFVKASLDWKRVVVYLCIYICVFASQTPRNIVSEVLLPLPFQKYITCYAYVQL